MEVLSTVLIITIIIHRRINSNKILANKFKVINNLHTKQSHKLIKIHSFLNNIPNNNSKKVIISNISQIKQQITPGV
jgi:hypothetical protein